MANRILAFCYGVLVTGHLSLMRLTLVQDSSKEQYKQCPEFEKILDVEEVSMELVEAGRTIQNEQVEPRGC